MGVTLHKDGAARRYGRFLYRVYVDGTFVGSVGRWTLERHWTMIAAWLPDIGPGETAAEVGYTHATRREAVEDLVDSARDFGPLS